MKKEVSIYHEYESLVLLDEIKNEEISPWDSESKDAYANFGIAILKTLSKYRVLNKKNLENCLMMKNASNWKKENLSKVLKMLRKGGFIYALSTKKGGEDTEYILVLYILSQKGADVLVKRDVSILKEDMYEVPILKEDISEILKRASLNQWHINVISNYQSILKTHKYYSFNAKKNRNSVPSMVTIKHFTIHNDKKNQKNVSIFTYAAPRKEEEIVPFMIELLKLQNYLVAQQRYRPALIVAVCENMAHASWLSWRANHYRQTRPLFLLYSLDIITNSGSLLANLYSCATDEEGLIKANINLT